MVGNSNIDDVVVFRLRFDTMPLELLPGSFHSSQDGSILSIGAITQWVG